MNLAPSITRHLREHTVRGPGLCLTGEGSRSPSWKEGSHVWVTAAGYLPSPTPRRSNLVCHCHWYALPGVCLQGQVRGKLLFYSQILPKPVLPAPSVTFSSDWRSASVEGVPIAGDHLWMHFQKSYQTFQQWHSMASVRTSQVPILGTVFWQHYIFYTNHWHDSYKALPFKNSDHLV